jgi:hypothetical protein
MTALPLTPRLRQRCGMSPETDLAGVSSSFRPLAEFVTDCDPLDVLPRFIEVVTPRTDRVRLLA